MSNGISCIRCAFASLHVLINQIHHVVPIFFTVSWCGYNFPFVNILTIEDIQLGKRAMHLYKQLTM